MNITRPILTILMSILAFVSCNNSDCTNGVQDGNETGIDCGGNCPACSTNTNGNTPSALEQSLEGKWKHYTTTSTGSHCTIPLDTSSYVIDFTLNQAAPPHDDKYEMYGQIGTNAYPSVTYWFLSSTGLINNQYSFSLANDTLYISDANYDYIYHKNNSLLTSSMQIAVEVELNTSFPVDSVLQFLSPSGQNYLLSGQNTWTESLNVPVNNSSSVSLSVMLGPNYSDLGTDEIITYSFKLIDSNGHVLANSGDLTECVPGGGGSGCGSSPIISSSIITLEFMD